MAGLRSFDNGRKAANTVEKHFRKNWQRWVLVLATAFGGSAVAGCSTSEPNPRILTLEAKNAELSNSVNNLETQLAPTSTVAPENTLAPLPTETPVPSLTPTATLSDSERLATAEARLNEAQATIIAQSTQGALDLRATLVQLLQEGTAVPTEEAVAPEIQAATSLPTPTPTPTEAYASLLDLPDFQGIQRGRLDETLVLDNSDIPLRGLADFDNWMNVMLAAEAQFPLELSQQVPFWNILQDEVPTEIRDETNSPVLLGLFNPRVDRTQFETTRLNYRAADREALKTAALRAQSLLTQVQYQGETRWAFTQPLNQLDVEGLVVPGTDNLYRGFAFGADYEASQMLLALQNASAIERAEEIHNQQYLSQGEAPLQLTDRTIMSAAFHDMHNILIEQGWDDSGFMPALYVTADEVVRETGYFLREIPMYPVGRVQMMPAESNERADQEAGVECKRLDSYDELADYGSQIDSDSAHLVLNVMNLSGVAQKLDSKFGESGIVSALDQNNRIVLAHLISEPEESGYKNIPENGEANNAGGFEVAPTLVANVTAVEDPFGVTIYEDCEPAPAADTQEEGESVLPSQPEAGQTPVVNPSSTPFGTPEDNPTPTPPVRTPEVTPTYLPTNNPADAPTRGPSNPDVQPTLVSTPVNTPVSATQSAPPVATPRPEQNPTSVFGNEDTSAEQAASEEQSSANQSEEEQGE